MYFEVMTKIVLSVVALLALVSFSIWSTYLLRCVPFTEKDNRVFSLLMTTIFLAVPAVIGFVVIDIAFLVIFPATRQEAIWYSVLALLIGNATVYFFSWFASGSPVIKRKAELE